MLIVRLAIRNLSRSLRKSILVGSLLCAAVALSIVGNGFFESSGEGLKRSFADCFTGDLYLSQRGEETFGLLGSATPSIGSFTSIPTLKDHETLIREVRKRTEVQSAVSQISGASVMEYGGMRTQTALFGVDGDEYFASFRAIRILEGSTLKSGRAGILLSSQRVADIARTTGKRPKPGDPILLSVFTNMGFRIRETPLEGIFEYPASNSVLDRIAYVDADTLRALNGMNLGIRDDLVPTEAETKYLSKDVADMFNSDPGQVVSQGTGSRLAEIERVLAQTEGRDRANRSDTGAWNFIILHLKPGIDPAAISRGLERDLSARGLDAVVGDWRTAAGSSATLAGALRSIYNIGLVLLAVVVLLVTANTLVIWVLERSPDIATMRALGASRGFIRSMFFLETLFLGIVSGTAGAIIGSSVVAILNARGIRLSNTMIAMVFGGGILRPVVSLRVLSVSFLSAVIVAALAWIYPVGLALRVRPAGAMRED
jgi:putative ABC transport system permease protein